MRLTGSDVAGRLVRDRGPISAKYRESNGGTLPRRNCSAVLRSGRCNFGGAVVRPALGDSLLRIILEGRKRRFRDILDEARWELDFLMSMTVPEGRAPGRHGAASQSAWHPAGRRGPAAAESRPGGSGSHRPSTGGRTLHPGGARPHAQAARGLFASADKAYADALWPLGNPCLPGCGAHPALHAALHRRQPWGRGTIRTIYVSDEFLLGGERAVPYQPRRGVGRDGARGLSRTVGPCVPSRGDKLGALWRDLAVSQLRLGAVQPCP